MQIKQLNEPIEVTITEWNTGGILTRIEVSLCSLSMSLAFSCCPSVSIITLCTLIVQGLRAFLPKTELMGRVNNFTDLKENVRLALVQKFELVS